MKIRGETEFAVSGTRSQEEIRAAAQEALNAICARESEIIAAEALLDSEHEVQIQVTLSAVGYARAEVLMDELATALSEALSHDSSSAITGRTTELVPA